MTAPRRLLPNLVIAGAPKCGTSSVHRWLAQHPDAAGSEPKETGYFCDPGSHIHDRRHHISNGLDGYCGFFTRPGKSDARVIFESTPAYLYHRTALDLLPDLPTRPHFLFILREPSAQLFSLYAYCRDNWDWIGPTLTFADFIAAARTGRCSFGGNELCTYAIANAAYADTLSHWRDRIGPERMQVMLFDDLVRDPRLFMRRLCDWIGLNPVFYDDFTFERSNETYGVRSRRLQRLNIALRGLVRPSGPLYRAMRRIYRRINTTPAEKATPEERMVMQALRREFAPANERLARSFGLDLREWH